jgi:hypothetical protein
MTRALKKHDIDGILIDNYALTRFSQFLEKEKNIRLESTIEHRIVYGMVLPSGSTRTEKCARRYMNNYRHEIFATISKQLKPLRRVSGLDQYTDEPMIQRLQPIHYYNATPKRIYDHF